MYITGDPSGYSLLSFYRNCFTLSKEALDSVFRNGIYCFALYLTGEEYQKERTILHKQLSSAEFRNLSKRKLRILRRAFLILPELTAAAIRKRGK